MESVDAAGEHDSPDLIWADGELIPFAEATMHVLSHATQRGTAVFDVLKIVSTPDGLAALGLREHVARFMRSMELMGMETEATVPELEAAVATVALANPGAGVVKLVAAWREVPLKALPISSVPSLWVAAMRSDNGGSTPESVAVRTATATKMPASMLPPSLKVAASYTIGVRERMAAIADGFDDVIFRTDDGDLAEGTTQSVFVIKHGRVLVPPLDSVLDGITRRLVLDLAQHAGIVVEIRPISWDEVGTADELFLCSTNAPVMPIRAHDDRTLVAPGPITDRLAHEAKLTLLGKHERSGRWLSPLRR